MSFPKREPGGGAALTHDETDGQGLRLALLHVSRTRPQQVSDRVIGNDTTVDRQGVADTRGEKPPALPWWPVRIDAETGDRPKLASYATALSDSHDRFQRVARTIALAETGGDLLGAIAAGDRTKRAEALDECLGRLVRIESEPRFNAARIGGNGVGAFLLHAFQELPQLGIDGAHHANASHHESHELLDSRLHGFDRHDGLSILDEPDRLSVVVRRWLARDLDRLAVGREANPRPDEAMPDRSRLVSHAPVKRRGWPRYRRRLPKQAPPRRCEPHGERIGRDENLVASRPRPAIIDSRRDAITDRDLHQRGRLIGNSCPVVGDDPRIGYYGEATVHAPLQILRTSSRSGSSMSIG